MSTEKYKPEQGIVSAHPNKEHHPLPITQNHPVGPPPIPLEYRAATPPPIPNIPPPLPPLPSSQEKPRYGSLERCLQLSKINDKTEAIKRLLAYAEADSEETLRHKLEERDPDGYKVLDIGIFTPDILQYETEPDIALLKKIQKTGEALGYTFANTPGYESRIQDIISKLNGSGQKETALEVENIFKEEILQLQREKDTSQFEKIDEELARLFENKERFKQFIEKQKNLPPEGIIYLYHGLNNGGYQAALEILNGASRGIEQQSGPTVSLAPLGQFWKGVGFRYALRRDQIEFPGEHNSQAIIRMTGDDGMEDVGTIINESRNLPVDLFAAEVMRSKFTLPDPAIEEQLTERLQYLSLLRTLRAKNT